MRLAVDAIDVDLELGSLWERLKMEKAAKLLTAALALWLSAATWANSAGLFEEQTKYQPR